MTETILDSAHARRSDDPDDPRARLAFFERLADAELFLLLEAEPEDDVVEPLIFPIENVSFVVAFDTEERLSEFAGPAPFAVISGRALAKLLEPEGFGLALNPDVAPSASIFPPEDMKWLVEVLGVAPSEWEAKPTSFVPPTHVPDEFLNALSEKLPATAHLARAAFLVAADMQDVGQRHVLAFVDAMPGSEGALSQAVLEALQFSGLDAGEVNVTFVESESEVATRLARVGLEIQLQESEERGMAAPGMDPDRPPKLR